MDLDRHLEELCLHSGVTGHEAGLAGWLLETWAPWVDEGRLDALGNYIGLRRSRPDAPPLLVAAAAHLDAIGLMVSDILPGGFLRVVPVGGVDRRLLLGQELEITGVDAVIPAVVGALPPHLTQPEDRRRLPAFADLFLDTGLAEDVVRARIPIGAPVAYRRRFQRLAGERVAGRYLDNRAGVAALTVALWELSRRPRCAATFAAVGTVGEEAGGLPGAVTATDGLRPRVAIAVDVTFGQHPGAEEDAFPLDGGPTVLVGPEAHPGLSGFMRRVAAAEGIAQRVEVAGGSAGTDAWAMQVQRSGAVSGVLSIPLRYMHTPVETVALADIRRAGRLLAAVVTRLEEGLVDAWTWHS